MSPAMQLSAVDLPHPDGPSNAMNSPHGERQIVQRVERVPAGAREAPRDPIEPQFIEVVFHLMTVSLTTCRAPPNAHGNPGTPR
jgi:hypothetical protein